MDHRVVALGQLFASPAESRDLDILPAEEDVDEAKTASDKPGVAEKLAYFVRMRRRGDVEVLRTPLHHQVPHAATDQVSEVIGAYQAIENLENVCVDITARYRML